ncbi:MAG TPA: sulfur carrier protein ThiS [Gemmatimonadaceae bacterium]|nr:sulfur carrier protein ThiS [Gemmatimonadaceae bacterium]
MTGTAVAEQKVALTINGARREIPETWSLADLLVSLELDPRLVVVEHNGAILRDRDSFPGVRLARNDILELVHFVGGG